MRRLLAYSDEISREPGQAIEFKVSAEVEGEFDLQIVKIRCGDDTPSGPGLKQRAVDADVNGRYPARHQSTQVGSFVRLPGATNLVSESFTLQAMIWPTLPGDGVQVIMGAWRDGESRGYALVLDEQGALALLLGNGER